VVIGSGDFAARLERAIERSDPKLIEGKAAEQHAATELQAPPTTHDPRFRRF
jgi:hypothetical protein